MSTMTRNEAWRFVAHEVRDVRDRQGHQLLADVVGRLRIQLGYFDERYYIRGADPDLSLKAWHAGRKIVPAYGAMIDHDELDDDRRIADSSIGEEDNRKLFAKWDLPPRNPYKNDFNASRPCTLRGLRNIALAA